MTLGLKAVSAGYLPFGDGCPSDHRALWIDLKYSDAFGYDAHPLIPPSAHKLFTKDPRSVERYNNSIREQIKNLGLMERLRRVQTLANEQGWVDALECEYNQIHILQNSIRLTSENRIRKLCMGAIPWSPKLQEFHNRIELWSCLCKKWKGIKMSNRRIHRILKKVTIDGANIYPLTNAQVEARLKSAFKAYKAAKKDALMLRDDFLVDLAKVTAKANDTDPQAGAPIYAPH
jgi:hypothetical protein